MQSALLHFLEQSCIQVCVDHWPSSDDQEHQDPHGLGILSYFPKGVCLFVRGPVLPRNVLMLANIHRSEAGLARIEKQNYGDIREEVEMACRHSSLNFCQLFLSILQFSLWFDLHILLWRLHFGLPKYAMAVLAI